MKIEYPIIVKSGTKNSLTFITLKIRLNLIKIKYFL